MRIGNCGYASEFPTFFALPTVAKYLFHTRNIHFIQGKKVGNKVKKWLGYGKENQEKTRKNDVKK